MAENRLTLSQELRQQLKLLPRQLQLGRLLELDDRAVDDFINATVDENPALIVKDTIPENEDSADDYSLSSDTSSRSSWRKSSKAGSVSLYENLEEEDNVTLYEHIVDQLNDSDLSESDIIIAKYMAAALDGDGYFTRTKAGIADDLLFESGQAVEPRELDRAWDAIRNCEPAGIGAADLRDCLLLQINRREKDNEAERNARKIIESHFDTFISRDFGRLARETGFTKPQLDDALAVISRLNPKPGRQFAGSSTDIKARQIVPDFSVLPDLYNDGRLIISMPYEMPDLAVEESFDGYACENRGDEKRRKRLKGEALFLKERADEARNVIELVKMRQATLMRIISAIADRQKEFFLTGEPLRLKPMVLRDIAETTGDDLSVISRATSGRYVQTIGGIFPIRELFSQSKSDGTPDGMTALGLMTVIKDTIDNEPENEPLSDEEIARHLNGRGISIARRTVAKYREMADIPTARIRKSLRKLKD